MRTAIVVVSAVIVLATAGAAHAASMVAGPLFPNGVGDSCSCEAVNVSTSAKTIEIQVLDKAGPIVPGEVITVAPGGVASVSSGRGGLQYCKFINASPASFRATMTCYFNGTDVVAVPAR